MVRLKKFAAVALMQRLTSVTLLSPAVVAAHVPVVVALTCAVVALVAPTTAAASQSIDILDEREKKEKQRKKDGKIVCVRV
jgi:hypothetical protein